MFDEILKQVNLNIATVRAIIQTNDRLRKLAFGTRIATEKEAKKSIEISTLIQVFPKETEWRVYDHCAVVTRLYAIYEGFVENLIREWLQLLPCLVPRYSDLPERTQNTHREGVGRLLIELKKNRFQHLILNDVVKGLFYGVTQAQEYELFCEAFLFHEQNLRKDVLEKLFADAGIENAWKWVNNHREVKRFVEEVRGNQNTAEGELNEFISYRNDAAHKAVIDELLGESALLELCDFIDTLCLGLAELVTYHVICKKEKLGQFKEIGELTEWFNRPLAAVAKVRDINLSVGTCLFLVNESTSCCKLATIKSIKLDDVSYESVEITIEKEVGFKFDTDARKGLSLYVKVENSIS